MTRETSSLRLGDLLTDAGLLKFEDLQEAAHIAKTQSLPVGRVLIMSGYLSERILQCAIKVQSLVKDGLLEYDLALECLQLLSKEPLELDQALQRVGWVKLDNMRSNKLGELLISASIIDTMQLDLALAQSEYSGLPLGRVLVNFGLVSEELLAAALSAQVFIRDKRITREQAVAGLIAAKERAIPLEQSLAEIGTMQLPSKPSIRLGQLLLLAGLIDESNLTNAVELGLVKEQPIGKTLLSLNLVTESVLAKALEAQALVPKGIDPDQAANILTTAVNKDITIAHASSLLLGAQKAGKTEADGWRMPLYQFLQLAGQLNPQDLEQAIRTGTQDTEIMAIMLRKAGILEDHVIEAAIHCNDLINKRVLRTEQAIMALNHCQRTRNSIYDCFDEFGWSQPKDMFPAQSTPVIDPAQAQAVEPIRTDRILAPNPAFEQAPDASAGPGKEHASSKSSDPNQASDDEDKSQRKLIDLVP
jgi:hypothetical protein